MHSIILDIVPNFNTRVNSIQVTVGGLPFLTQAFNVANANHHLTVNITGTNAGTLVRGFETRGNADIRISFRNGTTEIDDYTQRITFRPRNKLLMIGAPQGNGTGLTVNTLAATPNAATLALLFTTPTGSNIPSEFAYTAGTGSIQIPRGNYGITASATMQSAGAGARGADRALGEIQMLIGSDIEARSVPTYVRDADDVAHAMNLTYFIHFTATTTIRFQYSGRETEGNARHTLNRARCIIAPIYCLLYTSPSPRDS